MIVFLGALAALFGVMLLALPTLRVAQRRLPARQAVGLWLAGAGFLLLAAAALVLEGEAARALILPGVAAAVIGNIVQRRVARTD